MADAAGTMTGKICVVTGATSGIGEVTAKTLAGQGGTVLVLGRSREKCDATVERIRRETGNHAVESLVADFSSQAEICRAAQGVRDRYERLDVLVNNAGGMFLKRQVSSDGIELTFALNHLGYFLFTNRLLDRLKAADGARIVSVASDAHRRAKGIDFDDIEGERSYSFITAYAQSKLANILFTYELARRLEGTGVSANTLHPGLVATNFFRGFGWATRPVELGVRLFGLRPEDGAKTSIYLASSPEVEGVSGRYFESRKPVKSSLASYDEAAAARLWELSERMTEGAG